MPLSRRSDGDLVTDAGLMRRMMPYLMRTRTESVVWHRALYDLTRTLPWLERHNAAHEQQATLFHLLLFACGRALHARPGLNRFVSGGRIYQRSGVFLSFVAKTALEDGAPFVTVKLAIPERQTFAEHVAMTAEAIDRAKGGKDREVGTELRLAFAVPSFVRRLAVSALRGLDSINLMPSTMLRPDPMFTSLFLANLGSVGIDDTFHHLYEWGNCPLFGAMGVAKKHVVVGEAGAPEARDAMFVNWTFDERVNDGLYCMGTLAIAQRIFEDPAAHTS